MIKSKIVCSIKEDKNNDININDVGVLKKENNNNTSYIYFLRLKKTVTVNNDTYKVISAENYGDSKPNKICNVCHRILPTKDFDKNQNGKDNRTVRRPSCQKCREEIDGVNMSASDKKKWGKIKPNLSEFTCPICKKTTIPGLTSKVVLNHDHKTGKVYGWLCDSCNTGLGRFKDEVAVLKKAIRYLNRHQ